MARALAKRLRFRYLDTGAMYRAVTWYFLSEQIADAVADADVEPLLESMDLHIDDAGNVILNGQDVTVHLRSREVESRVSAVSARPCVRKVMRRLQRQMAERGPLVTEGRDMGSVVFPHARWKFFMDADPQERARRRLLDFQARGRQVTQAEVQEEMAMRDSLDSNREDAPLVRTDAATYVDTTGLSESDVLDKIHTLVRGETA